MVKSKDADRQGDYTLYTQVGNGGHRVATCYVTPWETEAVVCMQTHHTQSSPPDRSGLEKETKLAILTVNVIWTQISVQNSIICGQKPVWIQKSKVST